ncbi:glycosyltransferase [Nonomuraea sp. NPDC055795]
MRVAVLGLGSRGDTQPCVALAHGLAGRGHDVVVVAARRYAPLVGDGVGGGVGFAGLSVDPVAVAGSAEGRAWLESGPLGFVRGFRAVVEPLAETLVSEVDAACRKADLVLAPALGAFGRHLHDRYGMPYRILHFQPGHPTTAFPNPLVPARTLGRLGNRASYALVERLGWLVLGRMVNRLRARTLGLGRLRGSPFAADRRDRVPVLCGFSGHVVPRPADWPDHVRQTGYWTSDTRKLGDELTAFLEAGPPPVYVGFGSMVPGDPARTAEQVRVALRLAGVRAVVQGLPVERSESVLPVGEVAHEALFARVRAVVHHGGAGTTGAALRAGVPGVVCPFFSDQPFWGLRVAALGAGPPPLPISRLVAGELAARLRAVPQYEEKSQHIGRLLRAENGVKNAVDLIEES